MAQLFSVAPAVPVPEVIARVTGDASLWMMQPVLSSTATEGTGNRAAPAGPVVGCCTQANWYGPYWHGGAPDEFGEVGSTTTVVMDELVGPARWSPSWSR